jgi:ankyrin repeat protein
MPNNKKTKHGKKKRHAGTGGSRSASQATTDLYNACDGQGNTTLETVRGCIADGADVNTIAQGTTPLHACLLQGDSAFEIVKVLVNAGASIIGRELLTAVATKGSKCVALILQAGADTSALVGKDGKTALHYAAECIKDAVIVDLLLKAGAAIDAKDIEGRTPLHGAAAAGNDKCVDMLLKGGADKNAEDRDSCTPLPSAVFAGDSRCVELLLNAGAYKDAMNRDGTTALMVAAGKGNTECVKLLVKAGCDVDKVDDEGCSALFYAFVPTNNEIARALVLAGANVNIRSTLSKAARVAFNEHQQSDEMKAVLRLSAPPQPRCNYCGATSTTRDDGTPRRPMKCAGCRRAHFCNMECQRAAWNRHKPFCKRAVADTDKTKKKQR